MVMRSESDYEDESSDHAASSDEDHDQSGGGTGLDEDTSDQDDLEVIEASSLPSRARLEGPSLSEKVFRHRDPKRRLRGYYRPRYRELLNSVIDEAVNPENYDNLLCEPSTIGTSQWTTEEKSLLFSRLMRTGRTSSAEVSGYVPTKSEPEVRDYLTILNEGSVEHYLKPARHSGIQIGDIPAAAEISIECETQLNLLAEKLAYMVNQDDSQREKARHGDLWLVDRQNLAHGGLHGESKASDGETNDRGDDGLANSRPHLSALSLFNAENWLELASLFMSSDASHDPGWVDLIKDNDERPSIFCTAFSDFYNLAVSLTKRLIQASNFQAMSRLRANRNEPEAIIRHQDVQAACRIMGLTNDWREYWIRLPRRRHLEVWTRGKHLSRQNRKDHGAILSYDQVEEALRSGADDDIIDDIALPDTQQATASIEDDDESTTSYNSDLWTDASSVADDQSDRMEVDQGARAGESASQSFKPSMPSDTDSDTSDHPETKRSREREEDDYLEALDHYASRAEEDKLWDIIRTKNSRAKSRDRTTVEPKSEDDKDRPVPPLRKRKRTEDFTDWRENVEYRPEWEYYETLPSEQAFMAMGRRGAEAKARRLGRQSRTK